MQDDWLNAPSYIDKTTPTTAKSQACNIVDFSSSDVMEYDGLGANPNPAPQGWGFGPRSPTPTPQ
eukprot:9170485-Pyramimonas_sp.AAC.1